MFLFPPRSLYDHRKRPPARRSSINNCRHLATIADAHITFPTVFEFPRNPPRRRPAVKKKGARARASLPCTRHTPYDDAFSWRIAVESAAVWCTRVLQGIHRRGQTSEAAKVASAGHNICHRGRLRRINVIRFPKQNKKKKEPNAYITRAVKSGPEQPLCDWKSSVFSGVVCGVVYTVCDNTQLDITYNRKMYYKSSTTRSLKRFFIIQCRTEYRGKRFICSRMSRECRRKCDF